MNDHSEADDDAPPVQALDPSWGENPPIGEFLQRMFDEGRPWVRCWTDYGIVSVRIEPDSYKALYVDQNT